MGHAVITFGGCEQAEWFSRECADSFAGALEKNYIGDPARGPVGFVTASVDGRAWHDTMWFRDTGVFLRELALYGAWGEAKAVFRAARAHVAPNAEGFLTFPEHVRMGERRSGAELDGTAAIMIGAALLHDRLPAHDPFRSELAGFFAEDASPVRYLLRVLERAPFVAGSGEFGGGCGIPGEYYNVVQNALVAWALAAVARALAVDEPDARVGDLSARCAEASQALQARVVERFVGEAETWRWCLEVATEQPAAINADEINRGFGGINGAFASASEVYGLTPTHERPAWLGPSAQTFLALLSQPERMEQFARSGMWTQFDGAPMDGTLRLFTGPSYGQGYALQTMLLLDRPELYTKAANWLAWATTEPGYAPQRTSRYHFLERYYAPERYGEPTLEEGCGALNLVCVCEPLKVARLMIGLDDASLSPARLVPRLPLGWTRARAERLPVRVPSDAGHTRLDLTLEAAADGAITLARGEADAPLPSLRVRLGTADTPHWLATDAGATHFELRLPSTQ